MSMLSADELYRRIVLRRALLKDLVEMDAPQFLIGIQEKLIEKATSELMALPGNAADRARAKLGLALNDNRCS